MFLWVTIMKIKPYLVLNFLDGVLIRLFIINILALLILSQMLYPQSDSLIIEHITREHGLSNSTVWSIIQDKEGYLWFATDNGIERYDGYSFHSYINIPGDTTSFINATAYSIYMDKGGVLWIGTLHGLEKFNHATNSFTNYLPYHSEKVEINYVYGMVEDNKGIFWVTTGNEVFIFNKNSGRFTKIKYENNEGQSVSLNNYKVPFVDKDGSLWIEGSKGLDKFNYKTGKLIHFWHEPVKNEVDTASSSKYTISQICEDKNGILWLGTEEGLVEFNKRTNTFISYLPDSDVSNPYGVNKVHSLCLDSSGSLWVGTEKGIFTFDTKLKKFAPQFINKSIHDYYLGNNFITSLYIDHSGSLWAGTLMDGIYKVKLRKLSYKKYFSGIVNQVIKGKNGILWVRKGPEPWVKFNTKTGQVIPTNFINFIVSADQIGNIYLKGNNSSHITKIENGKLTKYNLLNGGSSLNCFETTKGMWYGCLSGGLYYINFKTGKAKKIINTEPYITLIYEDSSGLIWAVTIAGKVICYNQNNRSVSEFISDPKNPSSISGREFFTIYQDKKGRLWFATNTGLNKYIPSTRTFINFTEKDGLSGNKVYNILEDDNGNLWMGTDKGISKFNPETNKFNNFDVLKGLSSSHWWNVLAVKMDNGEMFFGRSYGLIRFYPDSIKENTYIPPIAITSFSLFDKPVPIGKEIKLTYDKNFLSFEFAALSYYNSQRNQYAYKMEGVDRDWVYSDTRHYASYPNMPPGRYIFKVKGSNNDGIWNQDGTSISITITPPWWKTSWAYISYGFIFILILYGFRNYELNRVKLKDKIKLDEAVLKEREETDVMKSRFFANISHEFRTPLTLISGPIEKIISKSSDENILKDAGIAKRNSKRLLQLVNQLLDLSRLEAGKLKLEASKGNIVSFVKGTAFSFESLSSDKDITLKILSEKDLIEAYFDREKMMKILTNILSNAFKFTPQNGKITVSIDIKPPCHPPFDKGVTSPHLPPFDKGENRGWFS